jgi:hypothetical protein
MKGQPQAWQKVFLVLSLLARPPSEGWIDAQLHRPKKRGGKGKSLQDDAR